ncbi:hypothetical protein BDP55DRAFT_278536 [Colletotrichum godetiae]|uniref:Uncharacterized protein n=1 Tax=Colletotrichum godetiae TaxID=1209918 RepID=A0AAJ0EUC2_9PEZI|nr:uncharacterized protein BDP55DRAFT_278536 [Colletotrichum godetiae]KAK1672084.1 hypothetical protein BDP55DRAFT_278536 [Colletotrichum godetiae]
MADHLQVNESSHRGPSLSLLTPPDSPPEPDAIIVQITITPPTSTSSLPPPSSPLSSSTLSWPSSPSSPSSSPSDTDSDSDAPIIVSTPTRRHVKIQRKWTCTKCSSRRRYRFTCTNRCLHCGRVHSNKIEEPPKTGPLFISRMFMRDKALLSLDDGNAECFYFMVEHVKRWNRDGPRAAATRARARARADYSAMLMARTVLRDSMMRSPPWLMMWPPVCEYA